MRSMIDRDISPELAFVTGCCRCAFAAGGPPPAEPPGLDWALVVRLARFHRVQGLVWKALASLDRVPKKARRALADDAVEIAAANLRAAIESERLLLAFDRAGIPLLFIKGLTLAALAYGDVSTKASVDIDMLVDRENLQQASALLDDLGCRLVEPRKIDKLGRWHNLRKESMWARPDVQIDLHTRLADNPSLIPTVGMESPRQAAEIAPGIRLPTLANEELFAYLCVHGSSSLWFRLKWVTDFAAFLHDKEVDRLYRRSQELGAGRSAAQALLLADRFYGSLQPVPALRQTLEQNRGNRLLFRMACRELAGRAEPREPTGHVFGTAAIHYSQFLLLPGAGFKLSELARQARAALA